MVGADRTRRWGLSGIASLGAHAALVAAALAGGMSRAGTPRAGFFAQGLVETTVVIELVSPSDLGAEAPAEPAPAEATAVVPRSTAPARAGRRPRPAEVPVVREVASERRVERDLRDEPAEEAPEAQDTARGSRVLASLGGAGTSVTAQAPQPQPQAPVASLKWGYRRIEQSFPRLPHSLSVHGKFYSVELQLCVAADGRVSHVGLRRGAARELDEMVVASARTWRYRPYLVDGVARPFCHLMKIDYEVE